MSLSHSPSVVRNGLVLYLDAANSRSYPGTGTTWTDLSGNGNSGSLINNPAYSSSNNGYLSFVTASNQYIDGVHNAQLDIVGDLTIDCWFRISSNPGDWVRIFGKGGSGNRTYGLWYNIGEGRFLYQRYGTSNVNINYYAPISLNTWHNLCGTTSGSSHSLYLNGQSVGSTTVTSTILSTTNTYKVGYGDIHTYHSGDVGNCKIYNRGLSATEVLQNYNATKGRYSL